MIPKEIGGSTLHTFETYFGVRSPAIALGLTSLLFLITERVRLAAVFCGLAFLIHPLITLRWCVEWFFRLSGDWPQRTFGRHGRLSCCWSVRRHHLWSVWR